MATMLELLAEAFRLRLMRGMEDLLSRCGYGRVAGVDEAGRGCLAGPVVAAAVVPHPDRLVPGVDDSKRLPAPDRERLAGAIRSTSLAWSVASEPPAAIDRTDILSASRRAMLKALRRLDPPPECALVDAVRLSGIPFPCLAVIRGDAFCYAVACASILAKVERDRRMVELDREYPHYGFSRHKGYAAPEHLAALAEFGPSPVHRLTFQAVVPRSAAGRGGA